MYFRLEGNGSGEIIVSKLHLLFALFCQIRDVWLNEEIIQFENGKLIKTSFPWLTGRDDLLTGRMGFLKKRSQHIQIADIEHAIQELAMGRLKSVGVAIMRALVLELPVMNPSLRPQSGETGTLDQSRCIFYRTGFFTGRSIIRNPTLRKMFSN